MKKLILVLMVTLTSPQTESRDPFDPPVSVLEFASKRGDVEVVPSDDSGSNWIIRDYENVRFWWIMLDQEDEVYAIWKFNN